MKIPKDWYVYAGILSFFLFGYGYFGYGLMHFPDSYGVSHSAPLDPDVTFISSGKEECAVINHGNVCMPSELKECIVKTGECRDVYHPAFHPWLVTTCWDPIVRHKIFYTASNRFCLGGRV